MDVRPTSINIRVFLVLPGLRFRRLNQSFRIFTCDVGTRFTPGEMYPSREAANDLLGRWPGNDLVLLFF